MTTIKREQNIQKPKRTTTVDNDFYNACAMATIKLIRSVEKIEIKDYTKEDFQFPIIQKALPHIKTPEHRETVLSFLDSFGKSIRSSNEEHMKYLILDQLHAADPVLFFDFCQNQALSLEQVPSVFANIEKQLNRQVPKREAAVHLVCCYAIRRLLGDGTARSPLLVGPPGGGKSELVSQFAKVMTAAGISTETIFQSMTQESTPGAYNEGAMRLLGTSKHWSNGAPGNLYISISKPDVDMGIVLLDEVDKTQQRDYLVGLIDPKMPLQDTFIREVAPSVNLRNKTLLLLTANDPSQLQKGPEDPLWSRMEPTFLRPYTQEEMIGLAVEIISSDVDSPFQPSRNMVRKLAKQTVLELGNHVSFRAILDQINDKIFHQICKLKKPTIKRVPQAYQPARKPIGFNTVI